MMMIMVVVVVKLWWFEVVRVVRVVCYGGDG